MSDDYSRRSFLGVAGATLATAAVAAEAQPAERAAGKKIKILGICGSPRKGKTTATALNVALAAARAVDPARIETELVELAGMKIDGSLAIVPPEPGQEDDFPKLLPKLTDPALAGIIAGSPVYFGNMSSLLKALFDRCIVLRKEFALSNKVGGAVAVGGGRNGGQEQVLRSIHTSMMGQEMILVGDGRPTGHWGGTLWNNWKDDILKDEFGISTAKNLGRRVAEVARRIAGA
jgi:multimeric flavodoxin WrbA